MRKNILYILNVLMFIPILTGCSNVNIYSAHSEPEELVVIKTMGIDYSDDIVTVTAAAGTTADGKIPEIYSSSANTLAEAVNGIQNGYQGNSAYFSHAELIIIGESAAENGVTEFFDYIGRNPYMRLSANLFIAKDSTARELIEKTNGKDITASDMLEAIVKRSELMAAGKVFSCKEVMAELARGKIALAYTVVKEEVSQAGDNEKVNIKPAGYALFENGKMTGYLNVGTAESAGIIMGHTKSGMLTVNVQNHGTVTLKANDIKTSIKGKYNKKELEKVVIEIKVKLNIEEAGENLNFINDSLREDIEKAAANEIYETAILAVKESQRLNKDFCGIGKKLNMKNPYKFRNYAEQWEEKFHDIEINIDVKTELKRSYDMENSLNYNGDEM